jgi:two-component system, OmpR family, response regulator
MNSVSDRGRAAFPDRLQCRDPGETPLSRLHVVHVDADRDRQEIVRLSFVRDPGFTVESCRSVGEAVASAAVRMPDVVLCEVVAPGIDGPAMLAQFAESSGTADIPLIFIGIPQPGDSERLKSLGAAGLIARPFDPMALAALVRRHLRFIKLAELRQHFGRRLRCDVQRLAQFRSQLGTAPTPTAIGELATCAHKLAGTAGVFGFPEVSGAASALEDSVIAWRRSEGGIDMVAADLEQLIRCIRDECSFEWMPAVACAAADPDLHVDRGGSSK